MPTGSRAQQQASAKEGFDAAAYAKAPHARHLPRLQEGRQELPVGAEEEEAEEEAQSLLLR